VPLTPLLLPFIEPRRVFARNRAVILGCRDRFLRLSVKMRRSLRSEVPSTVRGHPRSCVDRCQLVRGHVCYRDEQTLGAISLAGPRRRACALLRGYRELRSPSPPVVRLALFTRSADLRFSGSGYRPTTSATNYDARTHSRASDPRLFARPAFCGDVECALDLAMLFYGIVTAPPSKNHDESCEPRQPFQSQLDGAASAPQNETPKATFRPRRRLRATPRSDHRLRRWPLENSAGLRGPSSPERRTFLIAACCRRTTRAKVPLLT